MPFFEILHVKVIETVMVLPDIQKFPWNVVHTTHSSEISTMYIIYTACIFCDNWDCKYIVPILFGHLPRVFFVSDNFQILQKSHKCCDTPTQSGGIRLNQYNLVHIYDQKTSLSGWLRISFGAGSNCDRQKIWIIWK